MVPVAVLSDVLTRGRDYKIGLDYERETEAAQGQIGEHVHFGQVHLVVDGKGKTELGGVHWRVNVVLKARGYLQAVLDDQPGVVGGRAGLAVDCGDLDEVVGEVGALVEALVAVLDDDEVAQAVEKEQEVGSDVGEVVG